MGIDVGLGGMELMVRSGAPKRSHAKSSATPRTPTDHAVSDWRENFHGWWPKHMSEGGAGGLR